MKKLLLIIGAAALLWALAPTHLRAFSTITVCASGCTTTSLQTALDTTAACGDTIVITSTYIIMGPVLLHYRGCTSGTPITITSNRAATWLPSAYQRVTPSQLGNLAQIQADSSTNPAIWGRLDGSNRPPSHFHFIGVAVSTAFVTYELVGFNASGEATNSSQIADDITFDRCYFTMPVSGNYNNSAVLDMLRFDVTNGVIKNSYIGDGFFNGDIESHGIRMVTTAGPITGTNNMVVSSGSPFFSGGTTPSYPAYLENGVTSQYNYFWRPWKFNRDPAQPFAADYASWASGTLRTGPWTITNVSNSGVITVPATPPFISGSLLTITGVLGCTAANASGWRMTQLTGTTFQLLSFPGCGSPYTSGGTVNEYAVTVCTKNLGEFKWGTGITWQYNAGENSWWANQCQAQFTGFTDTLRTQWDWNVTTPSIGVFTITNSTHVSWSGAYVVGAGSNANIGDMALCLSMPTTGGECHAGTVSGSTFTLSTPLSATPGGSLNGWIVYTGSAKLENVSATHNVWRNVDSAWSFLALSYANGVGDAGFGKTHNFSQNLVYANNSYISGYKGLALTAAESDDSWNPTGFTFDHNTIYYPNGLANGSFVYVNGEGCYSNCATSIQPKFAASAITNSLFGVSAAGGNGPFSGDGTATIGDTTNTYLATSNVKNNALPNAVIGPAASGGNAISGNQLQAWADPFGGLASSGNFTVVPASAYYHAGTDGASLGADFSALPLVTNLAVAPSSTTANLTFTVAAGINDLKATQPCALEVSSSRNLISDLGTYPIIAALDPTITPGADLSTQAAVTLAGNNVTWPLSGLAPAASYYGRLQCYGDTEFFTFATRPAGTGTVGGSVTITGTVTFP